VGFLTSWITSAVVTQAGISQPSACSRRCAKAPWGDPAATGGDMMGMFGEKPLVIDPHRATMALLRSSHSASSRRTPAVPITQHLPV
jgi:hypothetical protein